MWQRRLVIASLAVALTCISAACKKRVLDLDYAITAFRAGDHATGIAVAQRLVENGDPNARSPLASMCYQHGLLLDQPGALPEELKEAAYWVGEGARLGLPEAQYRYAEMLLAGDGVEKQPQEAKAFLLQAAQAGLTEAQVRLAVMLRDGLGVGWDPGQAVKWFRRAAESGDLYSQVSLLVMYAEGNGVLEDNSEALFWAVLAWQRTDDPLLKDAVKELSRAVGPSGVAATRRRLASWTAARERDASRPGSVSSGTGFVVSGRGEILTNHHVVEGGCRELVVRTAEGENFTATIRQTDAGRDLAILLTARRLRKAATLRSDPPRLGESVVVAGFPLPGTLVADLSVTTGVVSALTGLQDGPPLLRVSAPVQPGNSGGPLLDGSGKVIGVVVGKLNWRAALEQSGDLPENINFAIQPEAVQTFLSSCGVPYKLRSSNSATAPEKVAKLARGFTVQVLCTH